MFKFQFFLLVFVVGLFSCTTSKKSAVTTTTSTTTTSSTSTATTSTNNYAAISGKITNPGYEEGYLTAKNGRKKVLKISSEGTFSDTIQLGSEGMVFSFSDGNEVSDLFLKNGYDLHLTLNTEEFDETLKYTGKGAHNSNHLAQKFLLREELLTQKLFDLDESDFKKGLDVVGEKLTAHLNNAKNLAPELIKVEKVEIDELKVEYLEIYKEMKETKKRNDALIGKPSPTFDNYENYKGGTTSLSDLTGKYVYIDVWATWCSPCTAEIPHLKTLEERYKAKNIVFVSISVDSEKAHEKWKKMIKEKKMGGIQLFADKSWRSDFVQGYGIRGIPRFILLDPAGKIVNANMSRPSNPKTVIRLDKLL